MPERVGDAGRSLRILLVRWGIPRPDTNSADRRLVGLIEQMTRRHRVALCTPTTAGDDSEAEAANHHAGILRGMGVEVPTIATGPFDRFWFERGASKGIHDILFFEYWRAAHGNLRTASACQPWAKRIIDSVDVHFLREEAEADVLGLGPEPRRALAERRGQELAAYRGGDAVVVVTRQDQDCLAAMPGMPPLYQIPNVVPIRGRTGGPRPAEILFVGGFNHTPNVDGILWFAEAIWPIIRARVPEARLTVVGAVPTPEVAALGRLDGIEVTGYVPATDPYLDRAAVVIAPLRYGAGMKGKVTEALACGAPVVSTTIGGQGFGAVPGEHLLMADDPSGFAGHVVSVLRDPGQGEAIGRAGRELVASLCSPEVVGRESERMLRDLAGDVRPTLLQRAGSLWAKALLASRRAARHGRQAIRLPAAVGSTVEINPHRV